VEFRGQNPDTKIGRGLFNMDNMHVTLSAKVVFCSKSLPPTLLHFLRNSQGSNRLSTKRLSNLTANEIVEIAQWSDMFVFDYLTAHYDR
jgi:hypothetical protein